MDKSENNTINYYNQNASSYFKTTINMNMLVAYEKLLKYLNPNDLILDYGCGSGRDTKFFLDKGFRVEAIDGSKELCKLASNYTNIEVKNMKFIDLNYKNYYNAIWASASILHVPFDELLTIIHKMSIAVKENGYIYTCFKDGNGEEIVDGKLYTYFNIDDFTNFVSIYEELEVIESWTSKSSNKEENHLWNNFIIRKK